MFCCASEALRSSPSDSYSATIERARLYLGAGVKEVWIIDPGSRTAEIMRDPGRSTVVSADGDLETPLLPGFSVPLADILD